MGRQTFIKNYNNLNGGVITDLNKLAGAPENAVKDALNFEFTASDGANRRKALDLESGYGGSGYTQLNSSLALGEAKQQVFTFKGILNNLAVPTHDIVLNTFEGKGVVYDLDSDQQLIDAVADGSVLGSTLADNTTWQDVTWSPELSIFVACSSTVAAPFMVSSDGVRWVAHRSLSSTPTAGPQAVGWSPDLGIFTALGVNHTYTSTDGFNWNVYGQSIVTAAETIVWAESLSLFVTLADGTNQIATSPDGITWTLRTDPAGKTWSNIAWSPELALFVIVADSGSATQRVATSTDGITWTLRTTPATDRSWKSVAWSPELSMFVAVGSTDFVIYSSDGLSWTETSASGASSVWDRVVWGSDLGLFVAVATSGTGDEVMTSSDGITWNTVSAEDSTWKGLTYSSDLKRFCAVASVGTIQTMISNDGSTWLAESANSTINASPSDWITLQGVPIGAGGSPELSILYNTDATTYELTTTLGLGSEALIRDFQGAEDRLAVDEKPAVMVFTLSGVSGTFSLEDIEITDGSDIRRFSILENTSATVHIVDKSIAITYTTEFDAADPEPYDTWTVLGLTSGATATLSSHAGSGISDAHRYNLLNQGWTQAHMDTYAIATDTWPSNSQTWYSGRDSSNNFSPSELDKIAFGNSEAPKGHVLLNPFKEWRHSRVDGIWKGAIPSVTYTRGFTTLAKFGSRIAMSGVSISGTNNTVYISPVLFNKLIPSDSPTISDLDFSELFKFYQKNDPTADIGNELLPDDGLVVPVAAANRIYKVIELQNAILVFADNGVWAIAGLDAQSGFATDAFSVIKVSGAPGTTNVRSIVATSESVYYWAADGVYAINFSPEGTFVAANITITRIGDLYRGITPAVREAAISYYDEYNKKLIWAYNGNATATYPEIRNKMLVLDLSINAFYPLKVPQTLVDAGAQLGTLHMSINGFTQDTNYPDSTGLIPLKLLVTEVDDATATNFKHTVMEFNNSGANFVDYDLWRVDIHSDSSGTVDEDAYIETWDDTLGDTTRSKQAIWVFTHMTKTEYGFEDLGGGALGALGQSSFTMQSRWDWNVSASGGKWGTAREIYRHSRLYVPADVNDTYDSGESVITTKNKMYGRGRALSLRFDAVAGKDAILLGYSIPYSVEGSP